MRELHSAAQYSAVAMLRHARHPLFSLLGNPPLHNEAWVDATSRHVLGGYASTSWPLSRVPLARKNGPLVWLAFFVVERTDASKTLATRFKSFTRVVFFQQVSPAHSHMPVLR